MSVPQYDVLQFQAYFTSEQYVGDAVFRSPLCPIRFCLKSVNRLRSVWITGRFGFSDEIVVHSQILAHEREEWTKRVVAEQLAAMGIPEQEQPAQIDEILEAVDAAEPGRVIYADVVAISDVLVEDYHDAMHRVTMESMETASYRRNLIPASKSAIEGLERVGCCSELESEQCAVCMERLIDDGNLDHDPDLGCSPDDLLDHETDGRDDPKHNFDQFREQEDDVQCPAKKRKINHAAADDHVKPGLLSATFIYTGEADITTLTDDYVVLKRL